MYQKVSKSTKEYQKVPNCTKKFLKNIHKNTENYGKKQENTKKDEKVLKIT